MGLARTNRTAAVEATVTSKGQITLPKPIRERLGIQTGSRIRFLIDARGHFRGEPVLYDLEDLWAMADQAPRPRRTMTTDQMNAAKARREW
jgi:AbrB family looped-hinge helix DNA binding protein